MNLQDNVVAIPYARAFFQVVSSSKEGKKAQESFFHFVEKVRPDSQLFQVLQHPLLPLVEKQQRARKVMGKNVPDMVQNFVDLLLAKKRFHLIAAISEIFGTMMDEAEDVLKIQFKTAISLSKSLSQSFEKKLSKVLNGKVILKQEQDENLLGGAVLQMGDRVWDGSLRGKLERMKESLLESVNT